MKILIIDDSRSVHSFVKNLLRQSGAVFLDAFHGKEAFEILAGHPAPDLILLDWEMPVMDGPTTLRELKHQGCPTPVIMMTTKNAPEDILAMLQAGASEFLMKPFTVDILLEKIETVSGKALSHAA